MKRNLVLAALIPLLGLSVVTALSIEQPGEET